MIVLLIIFAICAVLRIGFVAFHWNHLDSMWYDFDRRGLTYQVARLLSVITLVAAFAAAAYAIWTLPKVGEGSILYRYGTIFIAWLSIAFFERFPLHKFPRTNSPSLYRDAQADLITNLIMAVLSGIGMTALTGLYYWWRA
jgi:hypothetical protein